jgi:glucokinase
MTIIGIDLGGTKVSAAQFSESGEILNQSYALLCKKTGKQVGQLVHKQIINLIKSAEMQNLQVSGIGISVPGIYYSKTGRVWAPNIPGWEDYPLFDELRDLPELQKTRICIDSDRACYILGEAWKGNARGCRNAIFMAVGTGIGAGILIDGKILRGANDIAGCTGWLALDRPFHEKYIPCGCYEYYASGEGLARFASELLLNKPYYKGIFSVKKPDALLMIQEYDNGDEIALEVIDRAIEYWGMSVANLVSLFNPEKIILGGGVFGEASRFIDRISAEARKWAQPIGFTQMQLEVSALGNLAGLYGAGYLAIG